VFGLLIDYVKERLVVKRQDTVTVEDKFIEREERVVRTGDDIIFFLWEYTGGESENRRIIILEHVQDISA
jgi:hypothetical protein